MSSGPNARPPPTSTPAAGSQASSSTSTRLPPPSTTGPPAPSSPTRSKSEHHLAAPISPKTSLTPLAMPNPASPQRGARSQNTSASSSPFATLTSTTGGSSGGRDHQYQPSLRSSAASFVSSTSGDEDGPSAGGTIGAAAGRDARSAAATPLPPPTSYAQAARTLAPRAPSTNRLSSLGSGAPAPQTRQRSSSRARPAGKRHHTSAGITGGDEDDEVRVLDRGEELIRRRNKERRAHAAALGRGQSFIDNPNASIGSGGGGGDASRRVSRSKTPRDRESILLQSAQAPNSPVVPHRHAPPPPVDGSSSLREASRDRSSPEETDRSDAGSIANERLSQSWHESIKAAAEGGEDEEILDDQDGLDEDELDGDEADEADDEDVELTLRDRQDVRRPLRAPRLSSSHAQR